MECPAPECPKQFLKMLNSIKSGKATRQSEHYQSKKAQVRQLFESFDLLFDWTPKELARQITLMEYHILRKFEPKECANGAWLKPNRMEIAPNLHKLSSLFNEISKWGIRMILQYNDKKKRSLAIMKLIDLGIAFRELCNFKGVFEIICGVLGNTAIHRLRKTWELIPQKYRTNYENLANLMSFENNYKQYKYVINFYNLTFLLCLLVVSYIHTPHTHPTHTCTHTNFSLEMRLRTLKVRVCRTWAYFLPNSHSSKMELKILKTE
jgi:hypothetical protein